MLSGVPCRHPWESPANAIRSACNGTIVTDSEMGEVIQLQGDQRKDVQEFLTDKKEGLDLDPKTIKGMHSAPTSGLSTDDSCCSSRC